MNRGEIVSGIVLAGLGIYIVSEAAQWDYLAPDGPGPGFFPIWYGTAMIVLAVVLVIQNLIKRASAHTHKPVKWQEISRVLVAWGGFVACVALLKWLGFALSYGLFVLFMVAGMYRRPWPVAVSVAAGCSAGFYLVFAIALDVRLPTGVLGF